MFLAVSGIVLPSLEPTGERMLQVVNHELARASDSLALHHVVLPSVESFGYDREFRVAEEKSDDALLHVVFLDVHFVFNILFDGLR